MYKLNKITERHLKEDDKELKSTSLEEYEKELNKTLDYSKVTTIPLFEAKNDMNEDDFRPTEEEEERIKK